MNIVEMPAGKRPSGDQVAQPSVPVHNSPIASLSLAKGDTHCLAQCCCQTLAFHGRPVAAAAWCAVKQHMTVLSCIATYTCRPPHQSLHHLFNQFRSSSARQKNPFLCASISYTGIFGGVIAQNTAIGNWLCRNCSTHRWHISVKRCREGGAIKQRPDREGFGT